MKNMQKLAFGLLVAGLAIGFSAFKTATAPITYYQVANNQYDLSTPGGDCDGQQTGLPCFISYTEEPSVTLPFTYASKPAGGTDSTGAQRVYNP